MKEDIEQVEKKDFPFSIGDKASLTRTIDDADIQRMATVSGDFNPIHTDDQYAKSTPFKKRIAHGLFCNAIISALLGNDLPGQGTIILSEDMTYAAPVYIGDTITGEVRIASVYPNKRKIELSFTCKNQNNVEVMYGTVKTKLI